MNNLMKVDERLPGENIVCLLSDSVFHIPLTHRCPVPVAVPIHEAGTIDS